MSVQAILPCEGLKQSLMTLATEPSGRSLPLNTEKTCRNEARAAKTIPVLLQKVVGGEDPAILEFRHQRIADIRIVMTLTTDHGRVRGIGIVTKNKVGTPGRPTVLADDSSDTHARRQSSGEQNQNPSVPEQDGSRRAMSQFLMVSRIARRPR